MSKIGIRALLALTLSLVMVVGSVGVVEAAKPVRTMGWVVPAGGPSLVITMIPNSPSPGLYQLTCAFNYNDYKAWGYKYQWYKATGMGTPVYYPIGEMQYIWFEGKGWQDSGTHIDITIDGQTFEYLERYSVEVWLVKKNGKEIRGAWITAGLASF